MYIVILLTYSVFCSVQKICSPDPFCFSHHHRSSFLIYNCHQCVMMEYNECLNYHLHINSV